MLILIPGPNVALIVANSLRHGMRIGVITSLGTIAGIALQLLIVVLGLAAAACGWLGRVGGLHNRISGSFLIGAGLGLALSRRSM